MKREKKLVNILIAEDDPEDRLLIKEALTDGPAGSGLRFVEDGERLIDYLQRRGKYADRSAYPQPGIILLDLNLPKKDGREALKEIKTDAALRRIPIVVLTTSDDEEDIVRSYDLGANSYITKPATFRELADSLRTLSSFWLEVAELPPPDGSA